MSGDHPLNDLPPISEDGTNAQAGAARPQLDDTPERIGPYRILGILGWGGMGVVYRAEQENPRRTVALKVLKPGTASAERLRRFEQESQVLARLHHPGIAQIFEAGTADTGHGSQPFFAMELLEAQPLTAYADAHHLHPRARLQLLVRVCEAMQHAHQKGVIHRDLKPPNILVDDTGQPKILDFGVARVTDGDLQGGTLDGQVVGTLPYMSPEQAAGLPDELDTRSDVYALGVLGYELLTGRRPYDFDGRNLAEAQRVIKEQEPTPLRSVAKAFRGDLDTIVAKALEKDKSRRYQTASDLAADINRYLSDEPILARPASALYQLRKFAKRQKALVGGSAAVLVTLVVGIIAASLFALRAQRAEVAATKNLGESRFQTAELYMQRGEWRAALDGYDLAAQAGYPNTVRVSLGQVKALNALNDMAGVDRELVRLSQRNDLSQEEHALLSLWQGDALLMREGQAARALQLVREAIRHLPPPDEAYARGLLAETSESAVQFFQEALARQKFHQQANYHLAFLLLLLGRLDEARFQIDLAETLFPEDANIKMLRAWCQAASGEEARAKASWGEVKRRTSDPLSLAAGELLFEIYALAGRSEDLWENDLWIKALFKLFPPFNVLVQQMAAQATEWQQAPPQRFPIILTPVFEKVFGSIVRAMFGDLLDRQALGQMNPLIMALNFRARIEAVDQKTLDAFASAVRTHPEGVLYYLYANQLLLADRRREADDAFLAAIERPSLFRVQKKALEFAIRNEWTIANVHGMPDHQMKERLLKNISAFLTRYHGRLTTHHDARLLENFGEMAWQCGQFDLARSLINEWERIEPKNLMSKRLRAAVESTAEAYGPAIKSAEAALALNPDESVRLDLTKLIQETKEKLAKQAKDVSQEK